MRLVCAIKRHTGNLAALYLIPTLILYLLPYIEALQALSRLYQLIPKPKGLEFEYSYQFNQAWQFAAIGVWQDAGFYGIPKQLPQSEFNGNQITRTPELQLRVTPQYQAGAVTAAVTWSYVGERYSDIANQFALPAYQTWDFFAEYVLTQQLSAQLEVKNLTNTLGLTEGNPRDDLSHQEPLFYGRPIFGRTIKVALSYQF